MTTAFNNLIIISATYMDPADRRRSVDCTQTIQNFFTNKANIDHRAGFYVRNHNMPCDPAYGTAKVLEVRYKTDPNGEEKITRTNEHAYLKIYPDDINPDADAPKN